MLRQSPLRIPTYISGVAGESSFEGSVLKESEGCMVFGYDSKAESVRSCLCNNLHIIDCPHSSVLVFLPIPLVPNSQSSSLPSPPLALCKPTATTSLTF